MSPDYITIPLTKGQVTIVDACDADLAELNWYAQQSRDRGYYAYRGQHIPETQKTKQVSMARTIVERMLGRPLAKGEHVDHRNLNKLDNRRANLRVADIMTNAQNRPRASRNSSGYKGVSWHKGGEKWQAYINIDKKRVYLGLFDDVEDAYAVYCEAAIKFHGEFARLD